MRISEERKPGREKLPSTTKQRAIPRSFKTQSVLKLLGITRSAQPAFDNPNEGVIVSTLTNFRHAIDQY